MSPTSMNDPDQKGISAASRLGTNARPIAIGAFAGFIAGVLQVAREIYHHDFVSSSLEPGALPPVLRSVGLILFAIAVGAVVYPLLMAGLQAVARRSARPR